MIDIQSQNFSVTEAMRTHTEEKLEPMIHNYGDRIINVHVHLSDENGPKGGEAQHCLIHVELQKMPTVVVEDSEENLYAAIDNCCHRAERAVRKAMEKRQTLSRKPAEI
ncbi:ribosome-associated translation inhibitor RaiA [uncultured Cocleimonas sp.]|uniref:ribosome hibernation-promoting factor, HPF/YfiA family n=1 Tax=uncultured Cocleimonas sp. TaxID=1051587 RepID=UPI002612F45A|nr:ribosome-associated translation inhibitor RaiA [uncultured Cocleimonas sp.]